MIEIKKFNFSDAKLMKLAHKIRHNVFVIEQKCPEKLEWEFEEESTHFILLNNKKAIATARYRKTNFGYKLERFAVLCTERGKKYGHKILKAILADLNDSKERIYLHAQSNVLPFYKKMGFRIDGNEFEEAGILHFKMFLEN